MAVKIRLARRGRKKMAIYDVVVANSTAPRDGRYIEKIGIYNPTSNPAHIELNEEKAFQWIMKGAQPTDTVRAMLSYRGVLLKKHLQLGVIKGAITQEQADARFEEWKKAKDAKIETKKGSLQQQKEAEAKARREAETKVKEARAEAIRKKQAVPVEEAPAEDTEGEAAPAEAVAESAAAAPETEAPAPEATEKPAEEAPAEEAKAPEAEAKAAEKPAEVQESKEESAEEAKPSEGEDEKK